MDNAHLVSGLLNLFETDLERLAPYVEEGLVSVGTSCIEVTSRGELLVRNLALCFDRYWREKHEASAASPFSRTV